MTRFVILGGILLTAVAAGAQAKVYKWVDSEGRVHYSSQAPRGTDAREVKLAPPPASPPAIQAPAAEPEAPEQEASAEPDPERVAVLRRNCEIARNNLAILEDPSNRRFTRVGSDEPVYFTDEERATRIAQAKENIERFCNAPELAQQ